MNSPFQNGFSGFRKLSGDQFQKIRHILFDHSGIYFSDAKQYLLESRLNKRLNELKMDTFEDYMSYISQPLNQKKELSFLYNHVTINETYFFRNPNQLNAFADSLLPALIKNRQADGKKRLKMWSAACSSGEEVYTIAMLLMERMGPQIHQWDLDIVGTDISQKMLEKSKEAIYGDNSFRSRDEIHDQYVDKYFSRVNGSYYLSNAVKSLVSFSYLNLNEANAYRRFQGVDIIFCRNVMIYFDQDTKKKVINNFFDILNHGGYLLLGEAESLHGISSAFQVEHFPGAFVYKKE